MCIITFTSVSRVEGKDLLDESAHFLTFLLNDNQPRSTIYDELNLSIFCLTLSSTFFRDFLSIMSLSMFISVYVCSCLCVFLSKYVSVCMYFCLCIFLSMYVSVYVRFCLCMLCLFVFASSMAAILDGPGPEMWTSKNRKSIRTLIRRRPKLNRCHWHARWFSKEK